MSGHADTQMETEARSRTHVMWDAVAEDWGRYADHVDHRAAPVSAAMIDRTRPQPGDDVLELASGAGGLGLEVAGLVGPTGSVLLSDVAPRMVAVAANRAADDARAWVRVAERDLDDVDDADESYDVVLCREGLMFALDTDRACREIHRVLRPGGRTAVAVWGPPSANPWLALVLSTASDVLGTPVPPPGIPGPLGLSDPARLRGHMQLSGLHDVGVEEIACDLVEPSFESFWEHRLGLAGPLAVRLRAESAETTHEIRQRLRATVAPYRRGDALELPGSALVAWGTKR